MPEKISLDQIIAERGFTAGRSGADSLTKVFKAPPSWNETDRSARFVMTAEIADRYGDVVVAKGGDITEFMKNPVTLWAHNSRAFPIGMWSDLKTITGTPKRIEGVANFAAEGIEENADKAVKLIAAGMLRACSIGFIPKAWERITDKEDRTTGYRFLEWELLECSVCSIPANPAAIVKAAGGDDALALQGIELVLDEWAMTPEGLIVPRKDYERAYEVVKNKEVTLHEVKSIDEEADAPAVELNPLDIEAAVSNGIMKALGDTTLMAKLASLFGKKEVEAPTEPAPVEKNEADQTDPEASADPEPVEGKTADDDDGGETEEQFQARIAAAEAAEKAAEEELADEAEEAALRARALENA